MRTFRYALFFLCIVFILSFVSSASLFSLGNVSKEIQSSYGYGENLKGWMNISLRQVPFNSLFTFYNSNVSVYDFLNANSFSVGNEFNCSTLACGMTYETSNSGSNTASFSLSAGEERVVGLKIIESNLVGLGNLNINFTSNAAESCYNQLNIDVAEDENVEWKNNNVQESFCGNEKRGCYTNSTSTTTLLPNIDYCETVAIDSASALLAGADVLGADQAEFRISLDGDYCDTSDISGGRVSCQFNKTIDRPTNLTVCISQISGDYKIYFESIAPICGESDGYTNHDFSLFVRPYKFSAVGSNSINISSDSFSFLTEDCSNGCIIPIKFTATTNQNININSANLDYIAGGGITDSAKTIYSLKSSPSLISSDYQIMSLDNSGLKVPTEAGNYNLSLKLNDTQLFKISLVVLSLPIINSLYPLEVPAGIEYSFKVSSSGNISSYEWDFGDNSSIVQTTNNSAKHKYLSLGDKTLLLTAVNTNGEVNASFNIRVISPVGFINSTLDQFKNTSLKLNNQLSSFPQIVQTYIDGVYNLSQLDTTITSIKNQYENAGNDSEQYISLLSSLDSFNLPDSFNQTEKVSGAFLINKNKISVTDVTKFTGEDVNSSESTLQDSAFGWFNENLKVDSDFRVYSAIYGSGTEAVVTYLKLGIVSSKSLDKVYLVLPGISNAQASAGEIRDLNGLQVLELTDISSSSIKNVELIIPGKVSLTDAPLYLFPTLSELKQAFVIASCNNNNVCDASSGETWKNCRSDCSPWHLALIWIIVMIVILFIIYILLQEWYKRRYEDHLFKNKNDLYNLINFISNSEKQGLARDAIYSKLSEKEWDSEQIRYAYNKFHGKRTGMWEIPIFKFMENKEVTKQLNAMPAGNNAVPMPMNPFVRKNNFSVGNSVPTYPNTFNPKMNMQKPASPSKITPKDVQKTVFGNASRITNTTGYRQIPGVAKPIESAKPIISKPEVKPNDSKPINKTNEEQKKP